MSSHGTDDGLAGELLPPAFRLPVVHYEIRVAKLSGRSEIEKAAIDHPLEHQRRVAERAVGNDDGRVADHIVGDPLCLEKSVRGHSNRQLIGSARNVPRPASAATPKSAISAINFERWPTNAAIAFSRHFGRPTAARGQFGLIASSVSLSSA